MEKYKEKLIELFKKSCMDISIPRSKSYINVNIHNSTQKAIKDETLPQEIGSFGRYNWRIIDEEYYRGFKYNDLPPLAIGNIVGKYRVKYGKFFLILSYLFINNYRNRKKFMAEAKALLDSHTMYDDLFLDDMEKEITFTRRQAFIIHGTLFAILTPEEHQELIDLYHAQVSVYDEMKLEERLNK